MWHVAAIQPSIRNQGYGRQVPDLQHEQQGTGFHVQGILCGLNIQAIPRMEGDTGKK